MCVNQSDPWLSTEELKTLHDGTLFYYMAAGYPDNFPAKLLDYATPDGGLLSVLDQAIKMSEMLEKLTDHD